MSTPILGRIATVLYNSTEIGYAKGINLEVSADLVKDYKLGSDQPQILEAGNKSYKATVDKMYIDNTHRAQVIAGTKVTLNIRPKGTGAGLPNIALANFVFTASRMTATQDGIWLENLTGEGTGITETTQ